jgi:hypothetical protein
VNVVPPDLDRVADAIAEHDARGYTVLDAISPDERGRRSETLSHACVLVAVDGRSYWVKSESQQGLVSELICARLASVTHAGPAGRILRVTAEAVSSAPDCAHLVGVVFGSQDRADAVNARDIGALIGDQPFDPSVIDAPARARVIAFQTWVGVTDSQVLLSARTGQLWSLDHGDAFGNVDDLNNPSLVITDIPGVSPTVGSRIGDLAAAAVEIESVTETQIIEAVSGIPLGEPWRSPVERRARIVRYLIHRQGRLRGVLTAWGRSR